MHWFGKPPLWRGLVVVALVAAALVTQYHPASTVMHPFATADIPPGGRVTDFEWRPVPEGLLPPTSVAGVAATAIAAGDPLLPGSLIPQPPPPPGWWSVGMELSYPAAPGTAARVVLADGDIAPIMIEGVVISSTAGDGFTPATGLIAVPEEHAGAVAAAVQRRTAVVLVAP